MDNEVEQFATFSVKRLDDIALICSIALTCADFGELETVRELASLVDKAKEQKQANLLRGYDTEELTIV